jgi:16S rRNA (cytosine1402-N4)-methyltransferase
MSAGSAGIHHGMAWDSEYHSPALAAEVVAVLGGSALVLDGTLGGVGHAAALLASGVGRVVGLVRDPDALASAGARLAEYAARGRFAAYQGN